MPRALFDGLYEHLLTAGLTQDLAALEPLRQRTIEPLDPSDAHHSLARHLMTEHAAVREESAQLGEVLGDRIPFTSDVYPVAEWPLVLHRHYRSREILAAIGRTRAGQKSPGVMKGVFKVPDRTQELLFITLDKSARSFSVTTRYRDYAISPELFHWETPSQASVTRSSGRRYIESPSNGWSFFLFVRTDTDAPYAFLGPAHYVSHERDRPIAITWRLEYALPALLYQRYAKLAQG